MDVDRPGQAHDAADHRAADSSCHRLRRLAPSTIWVAFSAPGELDERAGDVVAGDPPVLAAELDEQPALRGERSPTAASLRRGQAGVGDDVHADQVAPDPLRHAGRPRG